MHTSSVLRKLGSWQLSILSKEERVLTAACLNHETHLGRVKSPQWNISRFMYIYANWTEEAAILPRAELSDAILRHAHVTRPDAAASPRVRISGSGEMMFSVMGTFSEVHLTWSSSLTALRVWATDGSDSWSHQEHLLQAVISQQPETLVFSITN